MILFFPRFLFQPFFVFNHSSLFFLVSVIVCILRSRAIQSPLNTKSTKPTCMLGRVRSKRWTVFQPMSKYCSVLSIFNMLQRMRFSACSFINTRINTRLSINTCFLFFFFFFLFYAFCSLLDFNFSFNSFPLVLYFSTNTNTVLISILFVYLGLLVR